IPVPIGFVPADKVVTVGIGALQKYYVLNSKGTEPLRQFKLSGKLKNGAFIASPAKFSLALTHAVLYDLLKDLGFPNYGFAQVTIPVLISLDGISYAGSKTINYKAKLPHPFPLDVRKCTLKFDFVKPNNDRFIVSGGLPLPIGFNPAGKLAVVYIGYL